MSENIETFYYEITTPVLIGVAKLTVKEYSYVLSDKSLYGAGTTRHRSELLITYCVESEDEVINIKEIFWSDKQNLLDINLSKEDMDKYAVSYINKSVSDMLICLHHDDSV